MHFHTIKSILNPPTVALGDSMYIHFHTIKSILNVGLPKEIVKVLNDFHTIKSILNYEQLSLWHMVGAISILLSLF